MAYEQAGMLVLKEASQPVQISVGQDVLWGVELLEVKLSQFLVTPSRTDIVMIQRVEAVHRLLRVSGRRPHENGGEGIAFPDAQRLQAFLHPRLVLCRAGQL